MSDLKILFFLTLVFFSCSPDDSVPCLGFEELPCTITADEELKIIRAALTHHSNEYFSAQLVQETYEVNHWESIFELLESCVVEGDSALFQNLEDINTDTSYWCFDLIPWTDTIIEDEVVCLLTLSPGNWQDYQDKYPGLKPYSYSRPSFLGPKAVLVYADFCSLGYLFFEKSGSEWKVICDITVVVC